MPKTKYRPGDFLRIDDRSGFRTYASKTKQEWTGSIVNERLWESRQPQDFVKGVRDQQAVPQPRPIQLPEVFIGTQPSIFIYNDPNIGSSFIIEDATGPGPYYTPSFGHAFVEIIPGNGFANTDVTPPPTPPVVVGDHPVVTSVTLTIIEPFAENDPVGFVTATHVDVSSTWQIISGDTAGFFQIFTGVDGSALIEITSDSGNLPLVGNYTLLVQVTNTELLSGTGVATIHVQAAPVAEVTDFVGSFLLPVVSVPTLITTMVATSGPNVWAITNGNLAGFFSINPATGDLSISSLSLTAGVYTLTITATNSSGTPGFGTATITVFPPLPPPPPPPSGGTLFTDESFVPILG